MTVPVRPAAGPAGFPGADGTPPWAVMIDLCLAVVFVGLIQMEIWAFGGVGLETGEAVFACIIGSFAALALALRSSLPTTGFAVNALAVLTLPMLDYASNIYQLTNLILLYSIAAHVRGLESWLALGVSLLGIAHYFNSLPDEGGVPLGVFVALLWVVAWLAGRLSGGHRVEQALEADRDLAAEMAATRQERLELQNERTQMARELHDLIGHTVNVMVVHAGGARRAVRTDPDGAERALETIESTGRSALGELDRLLGIFRSEDAAPTAPAPGLDALTTLVAQFSDTDLDVRLDLDADRTNVPQSVALAAYRIVQEALTNSLKHSKGTRADVSVRVDHDHLVVAVEDDGEGCHEDIDGGRGLLGIGERVALHHGTVEYGNLTSGGFRVACTLPLAGP